MPPDPLPEASPGAPPVAPIAGVAETALRLNLWYLIQQILLSAVPQNATDAERCATMMATLRGPVPLHFDIASPEQAALQSIWAELRNAVEISASEQDSKRLSRDPAAGA